MDPTCSEKMIFRRTIGAACLRKPNQTNKFNALLTKFNFFLLQKNVLSKYPLLPKGIGPMNWNYVTPQVKLLCACAVLTRPKFMSISHPSLLARFKSRFARNLSRVSIKVLDLSAFERHGVPPTSKVFVKRTRNFWQGVFKK